MCFVLFDQRPKNIGVHPVRAKLIHTPKQHIFFTVPGFRIPPDHLPSATPMHQKNTTSVIAGGCARPSWRTPGAPPPVPRTRPCRPARESTPICIGPVTMPEALSVVLSVRPMARILRWGVHKAGGCIFREADVFSGVFASPIKI